MSQRETVVILDYGSQYTQLIARRVREQHVYAEILPWNAPEAQVVARQPVAASFCPAARTASTMPERRGCPITSSVCMCRCSAFATVCICWPTRWADRSSPVYEREYGPADVDILEADALFAGLTARQAVWMSHGDRVEALPPGFHVLARSTGNIVAAMRDQESRVYGVQFHPEVHHTPNGATMLRHFLYDVCGCTGTWTTGRVHR